MPARAYWQGQIRLALVSIPVEVNAATKSGATIQFHQIHEPSGKRINYEKVVQGVGPVDRDEIVKGFEVSKGHYVLLDDDEIEAAKVESRKTLDLVQFVDAGEIDVFYFEKPYYVVPADDLAEEAFVVLREALKASNKVGIGQISVRGRETLVSLKPCGKGLVLETLRYEDEVRQAQSYFREIPATKPGLVAIEDAIAGGRSINVTLVFSVERYVAVARAYLEGLGRFQAAGGDVSTVRSVASFFVSRIDTETDRRLDVLGAPAELKGKLGIANAKLAYERFRELFSPRNERWAALAAAGAHPQRCLWASTSTKNPAYRDVLYVEELIGPDTVNTMPEPTLLAFQDHGTVAPTLERGLDEAHRLLEQLKSVGVDYDDVVETLEAEGVQKFVHSVSQLHAELEAKRQTLLAGPGKPR